MEGGLGGAVKEITSPNGNTKWTTTCAKSMSEAYQEMHHYAHYVRCITDTNETPSFLPFLPYGGCTLPGRHDEGTWRRVQNRASSLPPSLPSLLSSISLSHSSPISRSQFILFQQLHSLVSCSTLTVTIISILVHYHPVNYT